MVTRRSFLAGGAVALLAGCGEEDDVVAARPGDALLSQLAAERALVAATGELPDGAPRAAADTVREVSERSQERARRLAAAVAAEGGPPARRAAAGGRARRLARGAGARARRRSSPT